MSAMRADSWTYWSPQKFPYITISRFRVILKSSRGKWRQIVDMSAPEGTRMNDNTKSWEPSSTWV